MKTPDKRKTAGSNRGMVQGVTLIVIALLVLLGTTIMLTTSTDLKISANYREDARALAHAEAGAEYFIAYMRGNALAYPEAYNASATFTIPEFPADFSASDFSPSVTVTCISSGGCGPSSNNKTYKFQMTGTAEKNVSKTIEVVFGRNTVLPQGADGAVAMYGGGPLTVNLKTGGGGDTNIDGHNYPIPSNPNCSGSACRTAGSTAGAMPGIYTPALQPTVTGNLVNLAGNPSQKIGGGLHTEAVWSAFVDDVLSNPYSTTIGTRAHPAVSVVEVGQSLSGNTNGAGVLIVKDGASFSIGQGLCYEGVIVLLGSSNLTGAGNAIVYGSVITINHTGKTINASGNVNLYYSGQSMENVKNMDKLQRVQRKSWREVS